MVLIENPIGGLPSPRDNSGADTCLVDVTDRGDCEMIVPGFLGVVEIGGVTSWVRRAARTVAGSRTQHNLDTELTRVEPVPGSHVGAGHGVVGSVRVPAGDCRSCRHDSEKGQGYE
jgi:hypothetical protein